MGKLPTMRSDNSEILPYNFKDYLVFIGTEKLSDHPNFCMFNHWHDETEIIVPLKGHMTYNINGDLIKLSPGKGVFVNSNQIHYGFSDDSTDCVFIYALWHPMVLCATNEIENEYVNPITKNASIPYLRLDADTPWQKTILSDVSKMYEQLSDRAAPLMLQSRIFDIWHTIYVNTKQERKVTSSASPQLSILKDMLSLIHNGYGEKVTLNKIADAGKISISNCNVIFKKYLKESPIKYLLNYRLMKSTELLVENALPITEVAFEVGFSNPSYFIDAFKKAYGLTPNEYRKKFRASETFDPYADI